MVLKRQESRLLADRNVTLKDNIFSYVNIYIILRRLRQLLNSMNLFTASGEGFPQLKTAACLCIIGVK